MAKSVWQGFILSPTTGEPVSGAEIRVFDAETGEASTLYGDRNGAAGPGNPFFTGPDGFVQFYVDPSRIRVEAYDGGQVASFSDVLVGIVDAPYLSVLTVEADTSASIDMLTGLTEPGVYSLSCLGGTVSDDGAALRVRISTDGSTVETGATDYESAPSTATGGIAFDYISASLAVGNDAGESFSLMSEIVVDDDGRFYISSKAIGDSTDGDPDGLMRFGRYVGTGVTGIQIYPSAGSIVSGTFTLRRIG